MTFNVILGYVIPFILLIVAFYLMKTFRDERIFKWVKIAVKAAEQLYKESGQGREKLEYVVNWLSKKFKIPDDELIALIESAVYELKEQNKKDAVK